MNRLSKVLCLAAAFFLVALGNVDAQKFGHVNVGSLLSEMEGSKAANTQLETFQKQLVAKGEQMATKLQSDYQAFAAEAQQGNVPPIKLQEKQAEFQKRQQELAGYEQEVIQKVGAKREELLAPILKKVDEAIKAVGDEGSFTFIFDTSVFNTILFAEDAADVTELVKAKL